MAFFYKPAQQGRRLGTAGTQPKGLWKYPISFGGQKEQKVKNDDEYFLHYRRYD